MDNISMAEQRKLLTEMMLEGVIGKVFQWRGPGYAQVVKVEDMDNDGTLRVRKYSPGPNGRLSQRREFIKASEFRGYSLLTTDEVRRYKRGEASSGFLP
jgi:hypothetical protein